MNLLKNLSCAIVAIAGSFSISSTFADIADTPELSPLTDSELRAEAETVQVMYDPHDHQRERALQHRIMQIQMDAQNFVVDPTILMTIDLVPEPLCQTSTACHCHYSNMFWPLPGVCNHQTHEKACMYCLSLLA